MGRFEKFGVIKKDVIFVSQLDHEFKQAKAWSK
jgi:hypothetical protein